MIKKAYLSIIIAIWTLLITIIVNQIVIGSLWNKDFNIIHKYGGICNLGINTNFLLIFILLLQAYMLWNNFCSEIVIKIVSIIILIYAICHLINNSFLNYKLKNKISQIGLFEYMLPIYIGQILIFLK